MIKCTINEDGIKIWRNKDGQVHRLKGPALSYRDETPNGEILFIERWYYKNVQIEECSSQEDFEKFIKDRKIFDLILKLRNYILYNSKFYYHLKSLE